MKIMELGSIGTKQCKGVGPQVNAMRSLHARPGTHQFEPPLTGVSVAPPRSGSASQDWYTFWALVDPLGNKSEGAGAVPLTCPRPSSPILAEVCPTSAKHGPMLALVGRSWAQLVDASNEVWPTMVNFGRILSDGQIRPPNSGQVWPTVGQIRATGGQHWTEFADGWPTLTTARHGPNVGRCRPNLGRRLTDFGEAVSGT